MLHKVGAKGQIVIPKEIREQLGIEPGGFVVQHVVDGHLEVYSVPAEHNRSLAGCLAPYTNVHISQEEWHDAVERAWAEGVREDWERQESWARSGRAGSA